MNFLSNKQAKKWNVKCLLKIINDSIPFHIIMCSKATFYARPTPNLIMYSYVLSLYIIVANAKCLSITRKIWYSTWHSRKATKYSNLNDSISWLLQIFKYYDFGWKWQYEDSYSFRLYVDLMDYGISCGFVGYGCF